MLDNVITLKSQQRFKREAHNVCAEEVNKIALSSNDDKRLLAYDAFMDTKPGKVCKTKMLNKVNIK